MQSTKIKVGERYHVDSHAVVVPYGNAIVKPDALTVVEKGIRRNFGQRADGVRVEMTPAQYQPIMEFIDRRVQREGTPERKMRRRDSLRHAYPRQFVIPSRAVRESVEARVKRLEAERQAQMEAEAWRENELRDKAGGITLAQVGRLVEQSEREIWHSADDYRRNLATLIQRAQTELEGIEQAVNNNGEWPKASYYVSRALDGVTASRNRYEKAQEKHDNWKEMVAA